MPYYRFVQALGNQVVLRIAVPLIALVLAVRVVPVLIPFKILLDSLRVYLAKLHSYFEVSWVYTKDLVLFLDLLTDCQAYFQFEGNITGDLKKLAGLIELLLYLIKRSRAQVLNLPISIYLFDFIEVDRDVLPNDVLEHSNVGELHDVNLFGSILVF